jgi:ribonuclease D
MPWIRSAEALSGFVSSLAGGPAIGLDTESDSLHHYREKVCLIQIASRDGRAALVDTLAFRDLSPLAPLMAERSVEKVLHGADYDVATLKRDFGFAFAGIFDTMIAARFLGLPALGLAAVAQSELGVTLSKARQRDDWSRRPLSPEQMAYALADVRHLVELKDRLEARLRAAGRLEWVLEECEAVAALPPLERRSDPEAWLVRGAHGLAPRALAALRELHAWRERRAEATDTPAFKVLGNEPLLRLAEGRPRTEGELRGTPGVSHRLRPVLGELLAAIRRAEAMPESELPRLRRPPPRPQVPEDERRRAERLRAWRAERATALGLDVSVVLPQRLIDRLAAAAPRDAASLAAVEGLRLWRTQAFGEDVLRALAV